MFHLPLLIVGSVVSSFAYVVFEKLLKHPTDKQETETVAKKTEK